MSQDAIHGRDMEPEVRVRMAGYILKSSKLDFHGALRQSFPHMKQDLIVLPVIKTVWFDAFNVLKRLLHTFQQFWERLFDIGELKSGGRRVGAFHNVFRSVSEAVDLIAEVAHVGIKAGSKVVGGVDVVSFGMCFAFSNHCGSIFEAENDGLKGDCVERLWCHGCLDSKEEFLWIELMGGGCLNDRQLWKVQVVSVTAIAVW